MHYWTREMNKQSRPLAALQENLVLVPRKHMVAYNHLEIYFLERYHPLTFLSREHLCDIHTFIQVGARIHKKFTEDHKTCKQSRRAFNSQ